MKYLILVLVILLVIWLAKSQRAKPAAAPTRPPKAGEHRSGQHGEEMLACAHCGLMLPIGEALPGRAGVFCSEAHRALAEPRDGVG
jgi:uncharacterized protein